MTTHSRTSFGQDFFHQHLHLLELWGPWQKKTKKCCWPIDQDPVDRDCEQQHL